MDGRKTCEGLVRLIDLDSDFILELRYAADNNFTGRRVYTSDECYIDSRTAKLLIEAKNRFREYGYRVKIWDAYRPVHAQARFWELVPDPRFVSEPPAVTDGMVFEPRHLNGMSVDLTLTDLNGKEIEMPSEFDDFTGKASLSCEEISETARKNAEFLRDIMMQCGFGPDPFEWWHFNDEVHQPCPYLDIEI